MHVDLEQIKQLIAHLEKSKLTKFTLKKGDFELHLEKGGFREIPLEQTLELPAPPPAPRALGTDAGGQWVTSPMVGTYYASPSPEQPHFVKIGDKVHENTVVCIVEAMKVMNEVKAGKAGIVAEILAENGQPMEFGAKILRIR